MARTIDQTDNPPLLRFEVTSLPDKIASEQTHREEFMNVIKVYIRAAGDMKCEVPDIAEQVGYDAVVQRVDVEKNVIKFRENPETRLLEEYNEKITIPEDRVFYTKKIINPWMEKLRFSLRNGIITQKYFDHCLASFDAFKKRQELPIDGYALVNWKGIDPAAREKFLGMGINSVEKIAELNEEAMQYFGMGARGWKEKARAFLLTNKEPEKATLEITMLKNQNEEMREMMTAMQQKIAEMESLNQRNNNLDSLRDQYRDKTGKEPDLRWKESKLTELLS